MTQDLLNKTALEAWQRLLHTHASIIRVLDAQLQLAHKMTLSDYDVLVNLRDAMQDNEQCISMSQLSTRTLLTRSGMTRLVQGLEHEGLVAKITCPNDARVSYVQITKKGLTVLAKARLTHHEGINKLFASRLTDTDMKNMSGILKKIPEACLIKDKKDN